MSLPLLHAGRTNPGLSAALDLRFALDKSLTAYRGPTPSFSRASTGSYFDASGVLRYAALNLNLYSEQFDNAAYTKNQGAVSANQTTAPDGKITADSFTASAGTVNPYAYQAVTTANGSVYTFSIYVKKNTHDFVQIVLNGVANGFANFDINNGVLGTLGAGGSATSSIVNVGNGWYRCVVTYTTASTSGNGVINLIGSATAGRGATFTAAGTESVYLWGQQLELSSTVGTYCPTTSSANSAPRFDHTFNGTSWVSRGLLVEEQRTNIVTYSEQFNNTAWTANGLNADVSTNLITAPDGAQTADKLFETNVNGGHYLNQTASITTGNSYTSTIYVKKENRSWLQIAYNSAAFGVNAWANFDVNNGVVGNKGSSATANITSVGSGWYRCSITATSTATATSGPVICLLDTDVNSRLPSYLGDGSSGLYIWGAQLELGAFPTSYIGTTNSSVVRSADVCQITGSDFSGFWNAAEGSIIAEADFIGVESANDKYIFSASNTTTPSNTFISAGSNVNSSGNFGSNGYISGAEQFAFSNSANPPANSPFKYALAIKQNDFASSYNGASVLSDASGNVTSVQIFSIGMLHNFGRQFCGHIARLRYYNKRLPNATLQLLSEPDPTLNLQFASNKSLTPVAGPAPSFSRASTGTYFNASGVLTSASINTPRFDHVYSGGQWVSKGLLVEEQRTNLCLYSEQFNDSSYVKNNCTVTANSIVAPDGLTTADTLTATSSTAIHYLEKTGYSVSTVQNTISIFAKYGTHRYLQLSANNEGSGIYANFDLVSGVVGSVGASTTSQITNVGGGWYRCSMTYTATNTASRPLVVMVSSSTAARVESNTLTTGDYLYLWGCQQEIGAFPTSYIGTTSSAVVRSADVCQITGTSFNWMWNQGEGSFSFEADALNPNSVASGQTVYSFDDGSSANSIYALRSGNTAGSDYLVLSYTSGVEKVNFSNPAGTWLVNVPFKNAIGFKLNDFAQSNNGGSVATDTNCTMPIGVNQLSIGRLSYAGYPINGHIAKLIYYPARLTNTKLQQLST